MNNTFSDFDTQVQCEEYYNESYAQDKAPSSFMVMMWLSMQSLQVEVWKKLIACS